VGAWISQLESEFANGGPWTPFAYLVELIFHTLKKPFLMGNDDRRLKTIVSAIIPNFISESPGTYASAGGSFDRLGISALGITARTSAPPEPAAATSQGQRLDFFPSENHDRASMELGYPLVASPQSNTRAVFSPRLNRKKAK